MSLKFFIEFFENLTGGGVRQTWAMAEFDSLVCQKAQSPAGSAFGRCGASQGGNLGALFTVDLNGAPGARLIEQSRLQATFEVAPLEVVDGLIRNLQQGSNISR